MTVLRPGLVLAVSVLVACGGQALPDSSTRDDPYFNDDGTQKWVPVPTTSQDDGSTPVSIKLRPGDATTDAGVPRPPPYSSSSSSSSGSWGSSSGGWGGPPPWSDVPFSNDLDIPGIAAVCADRDAAKGSYTFAPSSPGVAEGQRLSITRDLTEHRYGDGVYRTDFSLVFRSLAEKFVDPLHGPTRREAFQKLNVHLASNVSHPNAFTVGQPQNVELAWAAQGSLYVCSYDGSTEGWEDGEYLPMSAGVVTLTRRDSTSVAGVIVFADSALTLTFDAPFGERFPGEDAICCLK